MTSTKQEGENGINMAGKESLGHSLSDEELEPGPTKRREVIQESASPQQAVESVGFKFQPGSAIDCNFGDQAKGSTNDGVTNSSSEDDFELLQPPEENGEGTEAGVINNSVPTTPTKNAPHKRTADVAHGPPGTPRTGSVSPPSSPASKKKRWEDFLKEDEEKKRGREREKSVGVMPPPLSNNTLKYILVAVIVLFVAAGAAYLKADAPPPPQSKPPTYTWKKAHANFYNWTKTLQEEFPKQNKEAWIQLVASISETLKKTEPNHPAVITALLPPSMDAAFASCFLTKVGNVINKAVAPILQGKEVPPAAVWQVDAVELSKKSISQFRSNVEKYFLHEGKVLIVSDVDKVKSEDHLFVFHGLCDSFHAVDKRATIFFIVRVPEEHLHGKYEWIHSRGGDIVNDVLTEAWKNTLSPDSGPAMVARVADAVILLNEGDQCKL